MTPFRLRLKSPLAVEFCGAVFASDDFFLPFSDDAAFAPAVLWPPAGFRSIVSGVVNTIDSSGNKTKKRWLEFYEITNPEIGFHCAPPPGFNSGDENSIEIIT